VLHHARLGVIRIGLGEGLPGRVVITLAGLQPTQVGKMNRSRTDIAQVSLRFNAGGEALSRLLQLSQSVPGESQITQQHRLVKDISDLPCQDQSGLVLLASQDIAIRAEVGQGQVIPRPYLQRRLSSAARASHHGLGQPQRGICVSLVPKNSTQGELDGVQKTCRPRLSSE
jgi:hypothetical protein